MQYQSVSIYFYVGRMARESTSPRCCWLITMVGSSLQMKIVEIDTGLLVVSRAMVGALPTNTT